MTVPNRPAWAQSVDAFASAQNATPAVTTALQVQFPDTSQLGGLCGGLLGGSAFTSGLMAAGDPNAGTAGALVGGSQSTMDSLCGLMRGASSAGTTPQSVVAGATDVNNAISASPMASGTVAMGGPPGNTALNAINGVQNLANTLFNILSSCGCGGVNSPVSVSPQQVITTANNTATAVNASPMAAGILAMGQTPGSGNVAVDAVNGVQNFANGLLSILDFCNCFGTTVSLLDGVGGGQLAASGPGTYTATNVSPQIILAIASATAAAVTANPFANDLLNAGAGSGNIAVDAMTSGQSLADSVHTAVSGALTTGNTLGVVAAAGAGAIQQNNANHVGHQSLSPATAVSLVDQNLLVSNDFTTAVSVVADHNWSWDGTDGTPTLGCASCVCDGTQNDLVSSESLVIPGETIEIACEVKWSGLTYTGTAPIRLGVQEYQRVSIPGQGVTYVDIGGYDVATVSAPAAASTGWVGIAGSYVARANVDQVRLRFTPAQTITAGTVKWDAGELLKVDLIAAECVPATGQTVDSIVTQLYGIKGAGFTQNQAAAALANNAAALVSLTAEVAALTAQSGTGAVAGDNFSFVGKVGVSNNWGGFLLSTGGVGEYDADGTQAAWVPPVFTGFGGGIVAEFDWEGTGAVSTTDYQLIQVVLSSAPTTGFFGATGGVYIYGRVAADWSSFISVACGSDGVYQIGYQTGTGFHLMTSGTVAVPGVGAILSLYCGDKPSTTLRKYKFKIGSATIASFTEVGTGSLLGASNRKWGWGGYSNQSFFDIGTPPSVDSWLAQDQ